jgi:ABC-type sugar transport system permease subunit
MNKHLRKSKNVLYVVPAVLLIIMFLYVPALYGFSFSMYKIKYLAVGDFVGLQNYVDILTDKEIWSALGQVLLLTMSALVSTVALGLALALWLNNLTRGFSRLMQTVIMIPWIISVIVSALLWRWILADDVGLLPYILKTLFGVKNVYFIEGKQWSMFSLVFVAVWRTLDTPCCCCMPD